MTSNLRNTHTRNQTYTNFLTHTKIEVLSRLCCILFLLLVTQFKTKTALPRSYLSHRGRRHWFLVEVFVDFGQRAPKICFYHGTDLKHIDM
jgi:hypothetical protein